MKRVTLAAMAVVILPALLGAQQPGRVMETARTFGFYGGWILAAFDSIPAGRYDYRPTPVQQSVGYIAQHLETANYQLCALIGGARYEGMTARDSLADTLKAQWPKDTLVARVRASLRYCQGVLARVDDAGLNEEVTAAPGRTFPRARYLLLFLTDLAEHYNQLAGYMRLLGMVPPSALPRPAR